MEHWKVGPGQADNEKLGSLLKKWRTEAQFSRSALARRVGLSSEYIRLIEQGKRCPVEGQFRILLSVFNVEYAVEDGLWLAESISFDFTSRIKEVRGVAMSRPKPEALTPIDRLTRLGLIVDLLGQADDQTLRDVHTRLRRSRKTP